MSPAELVRAMQRELDRVGCEPGQIDGKWGDKPAAAMARFVRYAKVAVAADRPTAEALDIISAQRVRICPLVCGEGTHQVGDTCVADPPRTRSPSAAEGGRSKSGGYQTCGRNGCQWVPAGCRAVRNAGGGGLGGKIFCP